MLREGAVADRAAGDPQTLTQSRHIGGKRGAPSPGVVHERCVEMKLEHSSQVAIGFGAFFRYARGFIPTSAGESHNSAIIAAIIPCMISHLRRAVELALDEIDLGHGLLGRYEARRIV